MPSLAATDSEKSQGSPPPDRGTAVLNTPFFIKGRAVVESSVEHALRDGVVLAVPELSLDELIWSRREEGPAFDLTTRDVLSFLDAVSRSLRDDQESLLAASAKSLERVSPLSQTVIESSYADLWRIFLPDTLRFQIDQELNGPARLDGWSAVTRGDDIIRVRAYPPRLAHILPGSAPVASALTIARSALTKGLHLLKMASNDPFTTTAILRVMASVDADHPIVRSFSSVYWRGGDAAVEDAVFRSQYFDKLVVWGGDSAIRTAQKYVAPGFEVVSFDPKTSISLIGRETFESPERIQEVAALAATDSTLFNQESCSASRYHFVEGSIDEVDEYCEALARQLGVERARSSSPAGQISSDVREEIDALRALEPLYRVWGEYDGTGLVVRSDEPVSFFPTNKTVNVVVVPSLEDAVRYCTVATQTVGMYPAERKQDFRDSLCSMGAQRIVTLGKAGSSSSGLPHDGFYPLHRMVRWLKDED
jgi:hypothetical protein